VHIEIEKAAEEENDQNNTSKSNNTDPVSVHIFSTNPYKFTQPSSGKEYSPLYCLNLKHPLRQINIPPPKPLSFFV
jgi:hypothetical protein